MSIGYETQIPPITTVNFYNGIANNGKLLRPRLIKAVLRGGEVVKEYPIVVLREHMAKAEAVKNIQDCLESVVSLGLGKKAGSPYFHVSGKTGTAQIWTKNGFASQYLVSFAGYFPSEKPLYSCIVCIQKGAPASGGTMCAPVFKQVAEAVMAQRKSTDYSTVCDSTNCLNPMVNAGNMVAAQNVLDQLNVKYNSNLDTDENALVWGNCSTTNNGLTINSLVDVKGNIVPDVRGYGLRDALYRLEKLGLKVKFCGVGRVTEQNLQPGYHFQKGQTISLVLGDPKDIPAAERDSTSLDNEDKTSANADDQVDHEIAGTKAEQLKIEKQLAEQQQEFKDKKAEKAKQNQIEQERKRKEQQQKQESAQKQPATEPKRKATPNSKKKDDDVRKNKNTVKYTSTTKKNTEKKSATKQQTIANKNKQTQRKSSQKQAKTVSATKSKDKKTANSSTSNQSAKKK